MEFIKRLLGMSNQKPVKISTASDPKSRVGLMADSLKQLRTYGCRKLQLNEDEVKELRLEDGTLIDDEEYFKSLPSNSVVIFLKENDNWESSKALNFLNFI